LRSLRGLAESVILLVAPPAVMFNHRLRTEHAITCQGSKLSSHWQGGAFG